MPLNQLAFPISFSLEDVSTALEELLSQKGWKDFEQGNISLTYTPYYFFSFDYFTEVQNEESKTSYVETVEHGTSCMNGNNGELSEELYSLLEESPPETVSTPEQGYPFEVDKLSLGEKDAVRLLPLKLSQQFQISPKNFSITEIQLVYVPVWTAAFELNGQGFEVQYNAANGEILQEADIPFRKKGFIDLSWETLNELKQPNKWLEYSHALASDVFHSDILHSIGKPFVHDRRVQIAALVVFIIILLAWYFRFI